MITPVIQEATEAPQPIIPPPNSERKSRTPLVIALIVAGVILLPLLLLGAGVVLLRAGGEEVVVEEFGPADPVEQFDVSGPLDMEMQTEILLATGPAITLPENVYPGEDRGVQEGSIELVATVTSPHGDSELYRYQAILLDSADQEIMDCLGVSQGLEATVSCRSLDETSPLLFWGTDERADVTWYSVAVAGLPLEATRLVTETVNGKFVGSAIVNGVSYQEWPAADGAEQFRKAARTVALDAQGVVVWSELGSN